MGRRRLIGLHEAGTSRETTASTTRTRRTSSAAPAFPGTPSHRTSTTRGVRVPPAARGRAATAIMIALRFAPLALSVMLAASPGPPAVASGYADVLDMPPRVSPLASRSLLQGVTRAGARLVAVGPRGHILASGDGGATWTQSTVPVSADLTA